VAKVTSKYQVTVPKLIAQQYGIRPGDEIDWVPAGDVIRVIPGVKQRTQDDRELKLRLFDQATKRHPPRAVSGKAKQQLDRGWTREELYERGGSR